MGPQPHEDPPRTAITRAHHLICADCRRWQWGREPHESPQNNTLEEARDRDKEAPSASTAPTGNFASARYPQLQQGGLPMHQPSPRTHKAHSRVQRESRAR